MTSIEIKYCGKKLSYIINGLKIYVNFHKIYVEFAQKYALNFIQEVILKMTFNFG